MFVWDRHPDLSQISNRGAICVQSALIVPKDYLHSVSQASRLALSLYNQFMAQQLQDVHNTMCKHERLGEPASVFSVFSLWSERVTE